MTDYPTVFAVVPTFNRADLLKECVDSLLNQSYPVKEIVVVNSGSTDCTGKMLSKYNEHVHVIDGDQDWWWATCMNAGIEYALSNGAEYILAMNDDTHLENVALGYLLETSQNYNDAIVGGIVKNKKNSEQMINKGYGAKYTKYRWLPFEKIVTSINGRYIYYTEGHSGRGVLFPASVYSNIGLYDTKIFPHRGDRDFSYRCLKAGIGQYLDSGSVVYLNFDTSYQGVASKRFTPADILNALFHKNGLYNIDHQYRFLRKHYRYLWSMWFVFWIVTVISICLLRMLPLETNILKRFVN